MIWYHFDYFFLTLNQWSKDSSDVQMIWDQSLQVRHWGFLKIYISATDITFFFKCCMCC